MKTNLDKAAVYLGECRQLEIPVLVPDVNASDSDFSLRGRTRSGSGCRRCATSARACRRCSSRSASAGGPFTDFHDFCDRVDPSVLNKRTIESLINGGGFDSLGHPRKGLLNVFEAVVDAALRRRRERDAGTMSLFDLGGASRRLAGVRRPPRHPRRRVRQGGAPARREGHARPLRERPPADGRRARAAPAGRVLDRRPERARRRRRCAPSRASSPRTSASTPSAATSWPRSCSKTSRRRSR